MNETEEARQKRLAEHATRQKQVRDNETEEQAVKRRKLNAQSHVEAHNASKKTKADSKDAAAQWNNNASEQVMEPVHTQPWMIDLMTKFHNHLDELQFRDCVTCEECWLVGDGKNSGEYRCRRCRAKRVNPFDKSLNPGRNVAELKSLLHSLIHTHERHNHSPIHSLSHTNTHVIDLSRIEEMLVALATPFTVWCKKTDIEKNIETLG